MNKYWLAKNLGPYEGWRLEGPFNNIDELTEAFEKMLNDGLDSPIKLFKELNVKISDNEKTISNIDLLDYQIMNNDESK